MKFDRSIADCKCGTCADCRLAIADKMARALFQAGNCGGICGECMAAAEKALLEWQASAPKETK